MRFRVGAYGVIVRDGQVLLAHWNSRDDRFTSEHTVVSLQVFDFEFFGIEVG